MNQSKHLNKVIKQNAIYVPSLLPPEYQQVEWIENNGNCYIAIAEPVYDTYHYTIEFEFPGEIGGSIIGGDKNSETYPLATVNLRGQGGSNNNCVLFKNYQGRLPLLTAATRYKLEYYYNNNSYCVELNGVSQNVFSDPGNNNNSELIIYFSEFGRFAKPCKIYGITIKDTYNGNDLYNLVPCYRITDNKPGMYNTTTDTFYVGTPNNGSSTFLVGNNV